MYGKTILFKRVVSTCRSRYTKIGNSKKLLEFLADMPKDNSQRISDVQRQRISSSKKNEKSSPSSIYLQVVGSGARGAPNTFYLFTDQSRYLFNCGEGTQRLCHEHKIKLGKLEHIFITSKTWGNIGGLPGLSLTLQDVGVPKITLHGPEGLDELYNATRRFIVMKDMNVKMAKCSPSEDFNDNVMSVKYVLLGPDENLLEKDPKPSAKRAKLDEEAEDKAFEQFINDDTDYYNKPSKKKEADKSKNKNKNSKSTEKDPVKSKTAKVLKTLKKRSNCTVAYICTFQKRFGTLDLQKCVERGVRPGPMLGKLKMGEDVILPDGTLVLSRDVKTPDDPGPVLIVLDVPDISYLKEAEFSAHFDNGVNPAENVPTIIVHYTPPHIFHHPTYRAFMSMFGTRTRHLILNTQNSCLGSEAVHRTQHKLHLLDPDIFPLLKDVSVPTVWHPYPPVSVTESPTKLKGLEELKNKIALAQFQNIINMEGCCKGDGGVAEEDASENKSELLAGRSLSTFHLRPKREFDRSAELKLAIQDYIKETMDVDGFATSLEQFRKIVDGMRYAKNGSQKEYPKLVFLGTGSCIPSKTRNTSAIVLHVDENRSMLLDCGESTFGQLVRFYGPKRVNAFLRSLKAIYISHLHADHHIGIIGVLQARRQAMKEVPSVAFEPLHLLAPGQIVSWLCTYDVQFERIRDDFALLPLQSLLPLSEKGVIVNNRMPASVMSSIGVQSVRTCQVLHCPNAFGVAIEVDGHKITYSGDTIPCDDLVKIGKDSTVLIHEATMEDELAEEARIKMHSTTSQAIEIGRRMKARYTVLTHFSQRYARLPRLNANILHDNNSVGIAFDNMQVTMSDLELLPHMYAPLQLMFAEHCVELEMKAAQRALRHVYKTSSKHDSNSKVPDSVDMSIAPVPATPAYRDSNASRLRQEKVRASSPAKRPRKRSRSGSCSSANSANNAMTKSLNSGNSSPERPVDVTTTNTIKESSYLEDETCQGHVIDTRSRTLNYASAAPSTDKLSEKIKNSTNNVPTNAPPKDARSGYGKPLVTPIHKQLTIRKCQQSGSSASSCQKRFATRASGVRDACNEKLLSNATVSRCKSPIKSWKAENRPSSTSVASSKRDMSKTKIPKSRRIDVVTSILVHLIFWRLFHLISSLSYVQWQVMITIVSVGILFWTAAKETISGNKPRWSNGGHARPQVDKRARNGAPTNSQNSSVVPAQQRLGVSPRRACSADRKPQGSRSLTVTISQTYECNIESWKSGIRTPTAVSPRSRTPVGLRQRVENVSNVKYPAAKSPNRLSDKQNTCIINGSKAKFANHSGKNFKPQLEDIKSSYLLLHKKNINRNIDTPVNNENRPKVSTPVMANDVRRVQLLEVKQRYRSRKFWNDSKYDKIEGLNWITWK